jgi:alpha-L-fucosidase
LVIARKHWKIEGTSDSNAYNIIDGLESTSWYLQNNAKMPGDLIIDLGKLNN